ncbi:DNA polymerase III subunit gamma/tau [Tumebacillus sp. DT12]|uniref:DNA-directed DNA polymerase n=1 Tax=Tumebacillus lacus TaxID=2995335 RepID=A0ABT3X7E6_9BACL|nr:DNA polymerase III subunit gamma/tau [Tumebacillus lacus]MCX7571913.1 DNA polymerase III subunit gamma/tau [Tumebacillus lacus]
MAYIALYREWRPQLFRDIAGQEHVTRTLQNALRQHRFAHAYLFNGPRGTGKTSAARVLAKAINCENGPAEEPCNECPACIGITKGTIMDVMEIDAASNRGVDEIRDLRDKVKFAPTEVRSKVYIIDEVHMLTTEAFNALLKTLEEPPSHVMFILATTEPHKLPATIISRCQRFDFRRITGRAIVDHLRHIADEKGVIVEEDALWLVARAAEGGMRDALSIFDQVISFGGDQVRAEDIISMVGAIGADVLAKIARGICERQPAAVLGEIGDLIDKGKDVGQLLHDLVTYFRDLLMQKTVPHLEEVQDRANYDREFAEVADMYETGVLTRIIEQMTQVQNELKWQSQGRLLLEMLMVRLCKAQSIDPEDMLERLEQLESKLSGGLPGGGFPPSPAPQQAGFGGAPASPDLLRRLQDLEQKLASALAAGAVAPNARPQQANAPAPGQGGGMRSVGEVMQPPPIDGPPSRVNAALAPAPHREEQPRTVIPPANLPPLPASAPTGGGAPAPRPAAAPAVSGGGGSSLAKIVTSPDPDAFARVQQFWPRVLDEVKQRKITAQAWLLAGKPVAVDNGYIVVAFTSQIHAETIMKPIHREIIEPVFTQLMNGVPHQLFAVMESEWMRFQPTIGASGTGPSPSADGGDNNEATSTEATAAAPERDELVEKAKFLFGSEHVEVVE